MMDSMDRQHYRVPVQIKVFYTLDTHESRTAMVTDYEIWAAHPPETTDTLLQSINDLKRAPEELKPLYNMIQWLNFKMDAILYQIRLNSRSSIFSNFLTTTDLSIAGFGFTDTIQAQKGDRLLLALHLPDEPVRPVYTVGTLVRNGLDSDDRQSLGAINFTEIAEADRERIARFTFDYERKLKHLQQQLSEKK